MVGQTHNFTIPAIVTDLDSYGIFSNANNPITGNSLKGLSLSQGGIFTNIVSDITNKVG